MVRIVRPFHLADNAGGYLGGACLLEPVNCGKEESVKSLPVPYEENLTHVLVPRAVSAASFGVA